MMGWMDGLEPSRHKFSGKVSKSLYGCVMLLVLLFPVFLSLADVFDIPLFSQLMTWLFSACSLMLVHVCGCEGGTWCLPNDCHIALLWRMRTVSFAELSGSGMHFSLSGLWRCTPTSGFQIPTVIVLWSLSLKHCFNLSSRYFLACLTATFAQTHFFAID